MFGFLKRDDKKSDGGSIADQWREEYRRDADEYPKILSMDPFKNWDRNMMPYSKVERLTDDALNIFYGQGDAHMARQLLDQAAQVVARIHAEDRLNPDKYPVAAETWPISQLRLARAEAYLKLVRDKTLDVTLLLHRLDRLHAKISIEQNDWGDFGDYYVLLGMRLALIGDVPERVAEFFAMAPTFQHKDNQDHAQVLLAIAIESKKGLPIRDEALRHRFQKVFDAFRPPRPKQSYYTGPLDRFELALIGDKYFVDEAGKIAVERAIQSVPGA